MKKITKSDIKQIKEGNHDVLMDCLEFLLDTYEEDKFDLGYQSCLDDMRIHAARLAERISIEAKKRNVKSDKKGYYLLDDNEVTEIIDKFFKE